jgi:hypothetical protein
MMQRSRTLVIAIPFLIILAGLVLYQQGYKRIKTEIDAIRDEKELKSELLNKYNSLISERPVLEKKLAMLKEERQAGSTKLIEASSPSIASATLQKEVKEIILGSGGTIKSERAKKTEDFGMFKMITISIDAEMPDPGVLSSILYYIETRTPYFVVKELDMRVPRVTRRRKGRNPGKMTVKFDVSALSTGK